MSSPKLSTLQACLLVLHEQPEPNGATESPRIWTYACQATACAQSLGLHQDPSSWSLESWEKSLRKKLWWATYLTDRWTSICHGQPLHIPDGSFTTPDLEFEDLMSGENVVEFPCATYINESDRSFQRHHAARFLQTIKLTKILDDILGCYS
jgi:hypothetical protein